MDKKQVLDKVKKEINKESRNGKYRDYKKEATAEQQFYLELTRKSEAFKACSPRQRFFVINYVLAGGNASRAMALTDMKSKYYSQQGARWLKQENVQNAIQEFWETVFADKINRIEKNLIDALYRRAFTNRWQYFNKDGTLKKDLVFPDDLGEDHIIVDGIEKRFFGKDADREVVVYKLADRDFAFRQLQSLVGLDSKNINLKTDVTSGVLVTPGIIDSDEWEKRE